MAAGLGASLHPACSYPTFSLETETSHGLEPTGRGKEQQL